MDNRKVFAILAAVMMLSIAGVVVVDADDTEAATTSTLPKFNIYVNYGSNWESPVECEGYNAYLAVKKYCEINDKTLNADTKYTKTKINLAGTYQEINSEYGKIKNINGPSYQSNWNSYVYIGGQWTQAVYGLGHYKPFSDYDSEFKTADVAICKGTPSSMPNISQHALVNVTNDNDAFKVTFNIKVTSTDLQGTITPNINLSNGISITGYGSDAGLALINALSTYDATTYSVDKKLDYYGTFNGSGYGYVSKLFGVRTGALDTDNDGNKETNVYWKLFIGGYDGEVAKFMLGWYSPLDVSQIGAKYHQNVFSLEYVSESAPHIL